MTKRLLCFTALLLLVWTTTSAFAGWEVINLHPTGYAASRVLCISGGQQVGTAYVTTVAIDYDITRASLWSGSAASWVDLNPAGCITSEAFGAADGYQVGEVRTSNSRHAALWSGTAASFVDLHPAQATGSRASSIANGKQVGYATIGGDHHASLWSGTAASWMDLAPAGSSYSGASDISGDQQVGHACINGAVRAGMWSGTAASWVSLHPAGAYASYASAISDGQQVGHTNSGGGHDWHASLWSGTAGSWVDLHPVGATQSWASDVAGGYQVGSVDYNNYPRAALWHGTAASRLDLQDLLGPGYSISQAYGIEVTGSDIWVTGWAGNEVAGREEAVIWHYTPDVVPEPSSLLALGSGLLALGGLIRRRR